MRTSRGESRIWTASLEAELEPGLQPEWNGQGRQAASPASQEASLALFAHVFCSIQWWWATMELWEGRWGAQGASGSLSVCNAAPKKDALACPSSFPGVVQPSPHREQLARGSSTSLAARHHHCLTAPVAEEAAADADPRLWVPAVLHRQTAACPSPPWGGEEGLAGFPITSEKRESNGDWGRMAPSLQSEPKGSVGYWSDPSAPSFQPYPKQRQPKGSPDYSKSSSSSKGSIEPSVACLGFSFLSFLFFAFDIHVYFVNA